MAQLNLRKVPEELKRRLKAKAAENGVTLDEECLAMIEKHCGVMDGIHTDDDRGAAGGGEADAPRGRGKRTAVSDVRKKPSDEVGLHPVQSVRNELAERGGHYEAPVVVEDPHARHHTFKAGPGRYCSDCKAYY